MTARVDIAAAATASGVVNVTPFSRQNPNPGEGSVRLDRRFPDESGFGWMDAWQVIIFLPQDLQAAEAWMDLNLTTVMEAVAAAMYVTEATPGQITLDTGSVPGVIIAGTTAHN